jgi:protein-tyrosine phosphatase
MIKKDLIAGVRDVLATQHVTFVCAGNICRSPMAEGLLKDALRQAPEPLRSIRVISCGTGTEDGMLAHEDAVLAMSEKGIDISKHRSRAVTRDIVAHSFALFSMRYEYLARLRSWYPNVVPADACVMRELMSPPENGGIIDPFNSGLEAYVRCRNCMSEAIPSIVLFISLKIIDLLFQEGDTKTLKEFSQSVFKMGQPQKMEY